MTTLREIHERCKARHFVDPDWKIQTGGSVCARCHRLHPCNDYRDAVAALAILNDSAPQCLDNPPHCSHRLVPDPPAAS